MSKGKFALGALVGIAAGVIAGMLTAPKSGKETRADLKAKASEMKTDATLKADELRYKGEKAYKDTRKHVGDAVDEARETLGEYRGRAERAVRSAKAELHDKDKTVDTLPPIKKG